MPRHRAREPSAPLSLTLAGFTPMASMRLAGSLQRNAEGRRACPAALTPLCRGAEPAPWRLTHSRCHPRRRLKRSFTLPRGVTSCHQTSAEPAQLRSWRTSCRCYQFHPSKPQPSTACHTHGDRVRAQTGMPPATPKEVGHACHNKGGRLSLWPRASTKCSTSRQLGAHC